MKVLGRGWQYTVYDLGNGRVLKKYNSLLTAYMIMLRDCFPYVRDPIWKLPSYYCGCRETALSSIKKISDNSLEVWMLANPKVLNDFDYEQDRVIPIHDYFQQASSEDGEKIIDSFVDFNKLLVANLLIDKSFNITKNFGIDKLGRVVLIDLGELYSSKAGIEQQIKKRIWHSLYVIKPIPTKLRPYFLAKMDDALLTQ